MVRSTIHTSFVTRIFVIVVRYSLFVLRCGYGLLTQTNLIHGAFPGFHIIRIPGFFGPGKQEIFIRQGAFLISRRHLNEQRRTNTEER